MKEYKTIPELISYIDQPNRDACLRLLEKNEDLFKIAPGSSNNHQAWKGGYYDHVEEVMNIGNVLYDQLNSLRDLPFSKSDLLLVTFLHDVEKPWKYKLDENGELSLREGMETKADHQIFRMKKLTEYGIKLSPEQENGLEYAEGEIKNYSNKKRYMEPLACLAHMCDVCSARLWFDYPRLNDSWKKS